MIDKNISKIFCSTLKEISHFANILLIFKNNSLLESFG